MDRYTWSRLTSRDEVARRAANPALESSALDALGAARWADGRRAEAVAIYMERARLLDQMRANHPATGLEQMDILYMTGDVQLSIGNLPEAVAQARRVGRHDRRAARGRLDHGEPPALLRRRLHRGPRGLEPPGLLRGCCLPAQAPSTKVTLLISWSVV